MYVFRDLTPEEPISSSGYISRFSNLTVTSVLLDEVFAAPMDPSSRDAIVTHEVRSLRDTRTLLSNNTLRDCFAYMEDKGHPRLWRLLGETALERLDFSAAEKVGFVDEHKCTTMFLRSLSFFSISHSPLTARTEPTIHPVQ